MAEKKKILYIVEAMGGGVFTYIVDLANELVNSYDIYICLLYTSPSPRDVPPNLHPARSLRKRRSQR